MGKHLTIANTSLILRVVELFYCIATFFYIRWTELEVLPQRYTQHNFDQSFILPCRYHYKVCYVLTVFEQPSLIPDHRYMIVVHCVYVVMVIAGKVWSV